MSAQPRDAATVLLLRDSADGLQVFMVKRNAMVDFMAGAHVFPGGKIDPEDGALAPRLRGEIGAGASAAHYVAAIRETFEEAGVLLGGAFGTADLDRFNSAIAGGETFATIVEKLGCVLDLSQLIPWTRWVTPAVSPKRFDAVFFLAAAPAGQAARHDQGETIESLWIDPSIALECVQRGSMLIAPATYKCLCILSGHGSVADAFAAARASPPRVWCPVVKMESGRRLVILSDDHEHPDGYARMPGPTRMALEGGRFLPV